MSEKYQRRRWPSKELQNLYDTIDALIAERNEARKKALRDVAKGFRNLHWKIESNEEAAQATEALLDAPAGASVTPTPAEPLTVMSVPDPLGRTMCSAQALGMAPFDAPIEYHFTKAALAEHDRQVASAARDGARGEVRELMEAVRIHLLTCGEVPPENSISYGELARVYDRFALDPSAVKAAEPSDSQKVIQFHREAGERRRKLIENEATEEK
jgi:hypothetical protein